jgi:hypothetical protein
MTQQVTALRIARLGAPDRPPPTCRQDLQPVRLYRLR